ncbi:hypothetical protein CONLIGDRAFT_649863 [Coniochaeta ligniaria NRRL 30616]|uniref:Uncharacterized protein n=1 Tax=Coniochaeta ligniaria NRRL 30616 TaxID=1408157 RepID=A0A1J7J763_9PEZI|nr:hypothetical protein CONLIGDRAFT_649863 [Coniochaeta ligniaria NRRL 30616]
MAPAADDDLQTTAQDSTNSGAATSPIISTIEDMLDIQRQIKDQHTKEWEAKLKEVNELHMSQIQWHQARYDELLSKFARLMIMSTSTMGPSLSSERDRNTDTSLVSVGKDTPHDVESLDDNSEVETRNESPDDSSEIAAREETETSHEEETPENDSDADSALSCIYVAGDDEDDSFHCSDLIVKDLEYFLAITLAVVTAGGLLVVVATTMAFGAAYLVRRRLLSRGSRPSSVFPVSRSAALARLFGGVEGACAMVIVVFRCSFSS